MISSAITSRSDLSSASIHSSSTFTILNAASITDLYTTMKTVQILENLTKDSEMINHYREEFDRVGKLKPNDKPKKGFSDDPLTTNIDILDKQGIRIKLNTRPICKEPEPERPTIVGQFLGKDIPVRPGTYNLWGKEFKYETDTHITACTDGSTYRNKPSGSGFVLMDDTFKEDEYDPRISHGWKITESDNFQAEMAAINKAIRSIPITVHMTIFTDSSSSITSVGNYQNNSDRKSPMKCPARPYLKAIIEAMETRSKIGTETLLKHVYSHTGNRDIESIGNAGADRVAKSAALDEGGLIADINKMNYELPYIVEYVKEDTEKMTKEDRDKLEWTPIHGNIRKTIRDKLKKNQVHKWSTRPVRGQLARLNPRGILSLIKAVWKQPTSTSIKFLLDVLNQANPRSKGQKGDMIDIECDICGTKHKQHTIMRLLHCPAVAHIWNKMEIQMDKILDTKNSHTTNPVETFLDKILAPTTKWQGKRRRTEINTGSGPKQIITKRVKHIGRLHIRLKAARQANKEK